MDKRPGFRKRIALELFRSIRRNRAKLHELRTLFWECTLRCNASCRHCGSDCHVSAGMKDMPVEDFLKVIDDITPHVNPNKVLVIFTGGEALVRKDIETCGMELYRRGYPWGIVSNGLLMTRERLDALLASGMHSATISLDGFEEAHNWLRRHPKSFENAVNAICMLAEEKEIVWDVVTCVNQKNFKDLKLFKEFLTEMGVKRWRLFTIFPVGRAAEEADLQLTNEQFTWMLNFNYGTSQNRIYNWQKRLTTVFRPFIKIAWSPPSEKMKWKRFITQPWLTNALVMNNTRWLATVPGYKIRKAPVHWWQPPRVQSTR